MPQNKFVSYFLDQTKKLKKLKKLTFNENRNYHSHVFRTEATGKPTHRDKRIKQRSFQLHRRENQQQRNRTYAVRYRKGKRSGRNEGNAYGQIQGLPTFFEGNETLYNTAMSLDTETAIHGGLICTGDKFITDRKELDEIKSNFHEGLAVDMESASIAQICYLYKVPFISFRIISDTPGAENHFDQYLNFWGEMANRSFKVTETFLKALPNRIG